jgi:pimeloyl-ACP methyl ester carboxylesterase
VIDRDNPTVEINWPESDDATMVWGNVQIIGTYNGTGSQVTSITIDDPRFTRVWPTLEDTGPYGEIGAFTFEGFNINKGVEFDVVVTVCDQANHQQTAARHVKVDWGTGYLEHPFTVTSLAGGFQTVLDAKLWTNHAGTHQPLVVLVHGWGNDLKIWEELFNLMRQSLLNLNYTVVAYTQRPGVGFPYHTWRVGSFSYLMQDLYYVIDTVNDTCGDLIDANRIGLVGHSIGSYVVTMAASNLAGYLREYQSHLKIVVEGAGPDNLYDAAWRLANQPASVFTGFTEWYLNNSVTLYCEQSLSPIGPGKSWLQAVNDWWDFCDFITVPFCAVGNIQDTTMPPIPDPIIYWGWGGSPYDNHVPLVMDIRFNFCPPSLWFYQNFNVKDLLVNDADIHTLEGHAIWEFPDAVAFAVGSIICYL